MRTLSLRPLLPLALLLPLAACVVGPDYAGPPAVAPRAQAAAAFRRAEAATVATPPAARWWEALGDAELDRLEAAAFADSPDLEVSLARVRQSRATLASRRADRLPSLQATAAYLRTHGAASVLTGGAGVVTGADPNGSAASASDGDLEFSTIGGMATWEPDLFGGRARAVEGAKAQLEAYRDDAQAAQVSLAAEVASAYVSLRDVQTRLALQREDAALQARGVDAATRRRAGGTASDLDVERLNDQLVSTRAEFAPLQAQIAEQLERLSRLAGREPGAFDAELAAPAPPPLPPASVAVGDPASLLRRRPDVRAAERRIAAANAVIGQRTADLFPKVTLLGNLGFGSTDGSSLLSGDSFTYVLAPFLQWRPFDLGRTKASIESARGQTAEAVGEYRRTVLGALADAETGLARYARQRDRVAGLQGVQASAERVSRMTDLRVAGGTATTIDQLDAERRLVSARAGVAAARAQLTLDYVTLAKSLGLGWSGS